MSKLTNAIDDFLEESRRLEKTTYEWYDQKLKVFSEWCQANGVDLSDLNNRTIAKFQTHLQKTLTPRKNDTPSSYTIHGYIQVIKSFASWCVGDDEYEDEVSEKAIRRMKQIRVDEVIIETYTEPQIKLLYIAAKKEYNQHLRDRDELILDILLSTGIRSGELCGLRIEHLYLDRNDPHIRVYGKRRKWREVGIPQDVRRKIRRYIETYRTSADPESPVLVGRYHQQMTTDGVDLLFDRLNKWAGYIEGVRVSAHTCRHTFAVNYLRKGGDIYRLSILMGHSSVKVTEVYLKSFRAEEARKHQI